MDFRTQIMKELQEISSKNRALIKKYDDDISSEMYVKRTLKGGLLASAAKSACDKRAEQARKLKKETEERNKWVSEMLAKYK